MSQLQMTLCTMRISRTMKWLSDAIQTEFQNHSQKERQYLLAWKIEWYLQEKFFSIFNRRHKVISALVEKFTSYSTVTRFWSGHRDFLF